MNAIDGEPRRTVAELASRPIAQLFFERAARSPGSVALRHKRYGVWEEVTWAHYQSSVETFALGLLELGLQEGDRVAIMSDPAPQWLYADLAAQCVGAIPYGIYVTSSAEELQHVLNDSGAKFFIAQSQEYVDRLLSLGDAVPSIEKIIVLQMRATSADADKRLIIYADVEQLGRSTADRDGFGRIAEMCAARQADDVVTILYTPGTTGDSKGVMLSSRNLITGWATLGQELHTAGPEDRTVSHMPLAHVVERVFSEYLPVLYGVIAHFPEDPSCVQQSMVEVSPTLLFALPRLWEIYSSQVMIDIAASGMIKRLVYRAAMNVQRRVHERSDGARAGLGIRAIGGVAYWIVCRPLLDAFGYGRLRMTLTGGAPVSADVVSIWQLWGVTVREVYGLAETGGVATAQVERMRKPGAAGRPLPGVEVAVAGDGEILVRGPVVFRGYWGKEPVLRQVVDEEGWLHTGDIGEFSADGSLRVIDVKQDILVVGGSDVAPSEIEHVLNLSPFIRDVMLVGDGRDSLAALIEIAFENLSIWARGQGVTYTGFTNLTSSEAVRQLIGGEVARANVTLRERGLPEVEEFCVLGKELDPEAGDEVTPTRRIRRKALAAKFESLISGMYERGADPNTTGDVMKPAGALPLSNQDREGA